jgi:hypothetical protein
MPDSWAINDVRVYNLGVESHTFRRAPHGATVPVPQDIHPADRLQRYECRQSSQSFAGWNEGAPMTENINVQYFGFQVKALVREYSFIVRRALNESSEFTLTIGNEAFGSQRVRFQDAPEICSLRLHRELAAFGNHPPQAHYRISETDLDDYRSSHEPRVWGYPYKPRVPQHL